MSSNRQIIIIAGPNGAGKTTFAREYLPEELGIFHFVNADMLAAGLSPFDPSKAAIRAGKLMLAEIDAHVSAGRSFAFETTLSGRHYLRLIKKWRSTGYFIKLIFLSLSSPELAVHRVKTRVKQGGHSIPEEVIRRRFVIGKRNFHDHYKNLADEWLLYDNSPATRVLLETGGNK